MTSHACAALLLGLHCGVLAFMLDRNLLYDAARTSSSTWCGVLGGNAATSSMVDRGTMSATRQCTRRRRTMRISSCTNGESLVQASEPSTSGKSRHHPCAGGLSAGRLSPLLARGNSLPCCQVSKSTASTRTSLCNPGARYLQVTAADVTLAKNNALKPENSDATPNEASPT
jgi:hypothetical protein